MLQSTLTKLGYYSGIIDSNFSENTLTAVQNFQENFGLNPDGIVSTITWNALFPYLNGYTVYTVQNNDTLFAIATRFQTRISRILYANPGLEPDTIFPGQRLVIPFGEIVPTNVRYTSDLLEMNLGALKRIYPFLQIQSIGNSVLGKELFVVRIGRGSKEVFYNASFHANEWITSVVLMKFIENFCISYVTNSDIYGYQSRNLFDNVSLYLVPMVNPDGVDLVTGAIAPQSQAYSAAEQIAQNYPSIPFPSGWKANIAGTDLNLQFPAGWEQARDIKFSQGFTTPAPRDFVGEFPVSAPESRAVYDFTLEHNFRLVISYHTQGEVIYWQFLDFMPPGAPYIASRFSNSSGYALEDTPYASSFAGYKDWFIQNYNRPGFTIEAGLRRKPATNFSV